MHARAAKTEEGRRNQLANLAKSAGRGGRKPTPKVTAFEREELNREANKVAQELYEKKLGGLATRAARNIEKAVKEGDVSTSKWLVERLDKQRGTRVAVTIENALSSLGDLEEVSRHAVMAAAEGAMSLEDLRMFQQLLKGHADFTGLVQIDQLRAELDELKGKTIDATSTRLPEDSLPQWGGATQPKVAIEDAEIVPEAAPAKPAP